MREKLVDQECERLAKHFLLNTIIEDRLTLSNDRVQRDTVSLAQAIQEAVEDWFTLNPIEDEKADMSVAPDLAAEALRAAAPDLYEALSMLIGEVKDCKARGCPTNWYYLECWKRARAALKKARAGVPDRKQAGAD